MSKTQQQGQQAEQLACTYLQKQGLEVVARNFRCKSGEIDLVMRDKSHLVFVEVRLRTHEDFGGSIASVTKTKQTKIIAAANYYLLTHPAAGECHCRFDVVAIQPENQHSISWIKNAFEVQY